MGGRAAAAAFYPLQLLKAILQGISDTQEALHTVNTMYQEAWDTELLLSLENSPSPGSKTASFPDGSLPVQGGGSVRIKYEPHQFKSQYLDEYTREVLPDHLVRAAIVEELE